MVEKISSSDIEGAVMTISRIGESLDFLAHALPSYPRDCSAEGAGMILECLAEKSKAAIAEINRVAEF